jgi:hypothetical protein
MIKLIGRSTSATYQTHGFNDSATTIQIRQSTGPIANRTLTRFTFFCRFGGGPTIPIFWTISFFIIFELVLHPIAPRVIAKKLVPVQSREAHQLGRV